MARAHVLQLELLPSHLHPLPQTGSLPGEQRHGYLVGRIARAKPHLRAEIVERLLAVERTHHQEGRKDLLKGDVIDALEQLGAGAPDRERVVRFVEQQLASSSPRTRKAAQAFLKRHTRQTGG